MTKAEALIYKYASFEKEADKKKKKKSKKKLNSKKSSKKKTYPFSRLNTAYSSGTSLGLHRAISQRAAMGRAATGHKGITKNEAKVLKALKGKVDPQGKTYPVSRALTSPATGALTGGAIYGAMFGPKAGLAGAGLVAGSTAIARALDARSSIGRARKGRKGTLPSDKKVLKALKAAKV